MMSQPSAPQDSSARDRAKLGAAAEIEHRDAAPQATTDTRPEESNSAMPVDRRSPGDAAHAAIRSNATAADGLLPERQHGAAAMLLGTGSGLSALWDKHWSHTDITRPPDHSGHARERSRKSLDEYLIATGTSDAGHLSAANQQPALCDPDDRVVVRLSVTEAASDGVSMDRPSNVWVSLETRVPRSAADSEIRGTQQNELASKAAGFAPVARLASLGEFMRSQSWRGAAQTSQPAHLADRISEQPVKGAMQSAVAAQAGGSSADADSNCVPVQYPPDDSSLKQGTADDGRVAVEIKVRGQDEGGEGSDYVCRLILSVPSVEDHSRAAAGHSSPQRGSRRNSLSGLFRASRPPHNSLPLPPKKSSQTITNASSSIKEASMSSPSIIEQQPSASYSSSAHPGQKRARWAVPGSAAVSSLYGLVQHAAEVPLAHANRAVGSLPGIRSHAAPHPPSTDRAADADMTVDIVMRIRTAASAVLEASIPPGCHVNSLSLNLQG